MCAISNSLFYPAVKKMLFAARDSCLEQFVGSEMCPADQEDSVKEVISQALVDFYSTGVRDIDKLAIYAASRAALHLFNVRQRFR